jgi:hypothetical protein
MIAFAWSCDSTYTFDVNTTTATATICLSHATGACNCRWARPPGRGKLDQTRTRGKFDRLLPEWGGSGEVIPASAFFPKVRKSGLPSVAPPAYLCTPEALQSVVLPPRREYARRRC